jgi:4-hydroxy-3-polyprenylbenzoate decarboxylase
MGERVMEHECGVGPDELAAWADVVHENGNLGATIASGSFPSDGMAVVPCSMKTLAAIAHGYSDNLLTRAADVTLKERRPLVLVPREMPYSPIHLENMLALARSGAVILPPSPAFYNHPQDLGDLVRFVAGKILDQLRIPNTLSTRWNGEY